MKFVLDIQPLYAGYKISCIEIIVEKEHKSVRHLPYWSKLVQDKKEAFFIFQEAIEKLSNNRNFMCVETSSFFTGNQEYPTSASAVFEEKEKVDLTRFIGRMT